MENCTIYSHHLDFDKVVGIVKAKLPKASVEVNDSGLHKFLKATIKGGFFSKTTSLAINYRQREKPSHQLDSESCALTQNLAGMVGFIQSFPAENEQVRNQLLYKVRSMNCEMPFMAEPAITPEFAAVLKEIVKELDALVFAQPNKLFIKSDSQYFADKDLNLVLDTNGRSDVSSLDVSVDARYSEHFQEAYADEQLVRKANTEKFLEEHGVKVNRNLPCVSAAEATEIRTLDEVIERTYALLTVAAKGEGIEQVHLDRLIKEKPVSGFSPKEHSIINAGELSDQDRVYATWRYEGLNVMLWALGKVEALSYPDQICDVEKVVGMVFTPSKQEFRETSRLRPASEMLDELDKVYCMHWACVDARIKGQQASGNINPSVVYERHYALNWLTNCQGQDWDDVQTNT